MMNMPHPYEPDEPDQPKQPSRVLSWLFFGLVIALVVFLLGSVVLRLR